LDTSLYKDFFKIQKKHWWFVGRRKIVFSMLASYFPARHNLMALDAGCGCGFMLEDLKQFGTVYGIDASIDALFFSKKTSYLAHLVRSSLEFLPFNDETFDLITVLDVLEHVDDDFKALENLYRILKKDGMIIIHVPAFMFLWSGHDEINQHKRRYTLVQLRRVLVSSGFTVEKITYSNMLLFPIVYIVRLIRNLQGKGPESDFNIKLHSISNMMVTKIFAFEKYLLQYMNFPFGVSILCIARKVDQRLQ